MKYYKILSNDLKMRGFQYQEGLNVDVNEVVESEYEEECSEGLHFCKAKDVFEWVDYGSKIAEVDIPDGVEVFELNKKLKAKSIILKNIRKLWDIETVKELVSQGADIHANHDYALRWTSGMGCLDTVKYLVSQGANIHAVGDYAFRCAAECGHLEVVKYLVSQGARIHANDDHALRMAAANRHLDTVKYLVSQGANIHAKNECALRLAAEYGYQEIVDYLQSLS